MKSFKGYQTIPEEAERTALPLHALYTGNQTPTIEQVGNGGMKRGQRLASSRVMRDSLMHQMETIVLQEAELNAALEILDYTRQRCAQQHDEIVKRLEQYEKVLQRLESRGATETDLAFPVENLLNDEERVRWEKTKEMVTLILPEVLTRLEDNIDLNNAKIRDVHDKSEELRAKRLALREDIAVKEEDIALLLAEKSSC